MPAEHENLIVVNKSGAFRVGMPFGKVWASAPGISGRVVDVYSGLIELHTVMVKLSADGIDFFVEHNGRKLVAWYWHWGCFGPFGRSQRPGLQIQEPVIARVGIAIYHKPAEIVELASYDGQSTSSARCR